MDEPGAGHRLDDGADLLTMGLLDPAVQSSERVDVGRDSELIEMLPLVPSQDPGALRGGRSLCFDLTSRSDGGTPAWRE